MSVRSKVLPLFAAVSVSALAFAIAPKINAQTVQVQMPAIGEKSIGGVVRGPKGPEAGV